MARVRSPWAAVAALFGGLLLGVLGAVTAFVGFADQNVADHVYSVGFARPGDDCPAGVVTFDVADGAPLACVRSALLARPSVRFPGFSDEQNRTVEQLARSRGDLDAQDQADIRTAVDGFAAGIPEQVRLDRADVVAIGPLWGIRLAVLGIVLLVGAVVVCVWARRR